MVVLAVALVITASILVHVLFSNNVTDLTVELLAAIIAVVLVVASVGVTIHFQVRSETEREYRVELFRQKLELYKDTIACVTRADDDGVIDDHEIEEMRNYARLTALVGNRELVSALAEFVSAVEESGSITREEDRGSSSRFPSTSSHVDSSLDEPPQFDEVRRLDGIISPQQILHYFVTSLFSGDCVSVYVLDSKQIGAQDVCEQLLPSYHVDPSAVSESKPLCSGGLVYNACHSSQGFQKGALDALVR